ncbi:MAG: prepilin-type N-terminal cleavage/methylation domain-containing protein [Oscillospiraceae bacterium]|nr:prepilin-type N-terminal cleavage/methylation domain-containing protein [Oscillospiraceae bacterium]
MKKDNKTGGFTLIEVIIAVTILAIITTPLLRMFTSAAKTNAKAKKVMQATTIAQNIVEDFKAYSMEDLSRKINNYNKDETGADFDIKITNAQDGTFEALISEEIDSKPTKLAKHSSMTAKTQTIGTDVILLSSKFVGNADTDPYCFVLKGVSLENSPTKYDAIVRLNCGYKSDVANISSMNEAYNAYYVEPSDERTTVAEKFSLRVPGNIVGTTELESSLSKTITVKIENNDDDNQVVTLSTDYTTSSTYVTDNTYSVSSKIIFNNFVSKQELKSVYIYYYPIYGSDARDNFKIINTTGEKINVYLIAMNKNGAVATPGQQAAYRARLNVYENDLCITESFAYTKILSNIEQAKWNGTAAINGLGNINPENFKYDATVWIYENGAISNDGPDNYKIDSGKYVMKLTASKLDLG